MLSLCSDDLAYPGFYSGWGSRDKSRIRRSGGRKSPSGVQGQSPGTRSGGPSPPEAEAKGEISTQFLTFSCTKFRI